MRILILVVAVCLLMIARPAEGEYPWCSSRDRITAEDVGGDLVLLHELATYNCCPDSFTYELTVDEYTLQVTELEQLTMPCDCLCCYHLGTTVTGLAPGEWTVVYRWLDDRDFGWREEILTVRLEGAAQAGPALAVRFEATDCLDSSGDVLPPATVASLDGNYPNPFNPATRIVFETPRRTLVSLHVYDFAGRLVRTLLSDESSRAGRNEVFWDGCGDDGREAASGVYFYRLTAGAFDATRRMILLR